MRGGDEEVEERGEGTEESEEEEEGVAVLCWIIERSEGYERGLVVVVRMGLGTDQHLLER